MPCCAARDAERRLGGLLESADERASGGTRLHDAIKFAIDELVKSKHEQRDMIKQVVVLSDGGDNCSSTTSDELVEIIKKPGVSHFHIIGVGIAAADCTFSLFEEMKASAHHASFISGEGVKMKDSFRKLARMIRKVVVTMVSHEEVHKRGVSSRGAGQSSSSPLPTTGTSSSRSPRTRRDSDTTSAAASTTVCRYFSNGHCRFGDQCHFLHIADTLASAELRCSDQPDKPTHRSPRNSTSPRAPNAGPRDRPNHRSPRNSTSPRVPQGRPRDRPPGDSGSSHQRQSRGHAPAAARVPPPPPRPPIRDNGVQEDIMAVLGPEVRRLLLQHHSSASVNLSNDESDNNTFR